MTMKMLGKLGDREYRVMNFLKTRKGEHATGKINALLGINYHVVEETLEELERQGKVVVRREGKKNKYWRKK